MAGATNRQLKTAGIPKAAMAQIRVHAGGRLTLKSALDVAARHSIAVPDTAHAFMAARDLKARKVALQAAGARRVANVTRAIGDASKVALAARKEAARQKSVSQPVDAAKSRGKSGVVKNGETTEYGSASVTKRVLRSTVAARDGAGTKIGKRQFSSTQYIVKHEGKIVDVMTDHKAAVALAKARGASDAEQRARAVDIAAERAAREGKKNASDGRRVAAWRKKSTGKRIL